MLKDLKQDMEELKMKHRAELNNLKNLEEQVAAKGLASVLKVEGQLTQSQNEVKILQDELTK